MAYAGLYDVDSLTWGSTPVGKIIRSLSLGVVAMILATYLLKMPGLSRGWTLLVWFIAILAVLVTRAIIGFGATYLRTKGRLSQRTVVVGANAEASDIVRILRSDLTAGLVPVGCVASSVSERLDLNYCVEELPMLGHARDIVAIVQDSRAETVVIASSAFDHDVLARMIAELRSLDVDVHVSSGLFEVLTSRVLVTEVAGVPLITIRGVSLSRGSLLAKRIFDVAVASFIAVIGLPVWLLLVLSVKLSSPGPILYAQERVGRDGTRFAMLKFRSMYLDSDSRLDELCEENEASGPLFKMKDDPRITPVGKWLRRYSLDEIPQLLNVLGGTMSLVGPRPPLPCEVEEYSSHHWRRLEVVPGMTGLWQVSGRSSLTFDEMVRLDVFYIENWSLALDISLIFRTIPAVLLARGAY
jgi:exopolysaccharide biosynthesis polyprenyl glycosylphosphotransferase